MRHHQYERSVLNSSEKEKKEKPFKKKMILPSFFFPKYFSQVKIVTGKDGQTGTPVAIATQLPPNVSAAFSSQQQPFQVLFNGSKM